MLLFYHNIKEVILSMTQMWYKKLVFCLFFFLILDIVFAIQMPWIKVITSSVIIRFNNIQWLFWKRSYSPPCLMDNKFCTTKTPCNDPCEQKSFFFFLNCKNIFIHLWTAFLSILKSLAMQVISHWNLSLHSVYSESFQGWT